MRDPYDILGVSRTAAQDEIRKAYRSLAKKYHPDLNPGDEAAASRFKEIASAYDIVGDEEKRRKFDAGEIDASGAETERRYYRDYATADHGSNPYHSAEGYRDFADLSDLFGDVFERRSGEGGRRPRRGRTVTYHLVVDFLDAVNGTTTRVTMPDGRSLDITIPAGLRDGQTMRLRGKGEPGRDGGEAGDALIEVEVAPHPLFVRKGDDIETEVPIGIDEAALGATVPVDTIGGRVNLKVPAGSNAGQTLRLRGRGVRRPGAEPGDHLVRLRIVMPPSVDDELRSFLEGWRSRHGYDPRKP